MEQIRKPFQGVLNIIRFNWHLYAIALFIVLATLLLINYFDIPYSKYIYTLVVLIIISILLSFFTSLYVYDISGLYRLNWIESNNQEKLIVNINAGFDETSYLIKEKFQNAALIVLDFYNPEKQMEVSIKRARKAYPSFPNTKLINSSNITLANNSADKIFVFLSAHEIRNENDRIAFFTELKRVIKPKGEIYITEHLRDLPNLLAYNIGFFHFYTKSSWYKIFNKANLIVTKEIKITPFISTFMLNTNGNTF